MELKIDSLKLHDQTLINQLELLKTGILITAYSSDGVLSIVFQPLLLATSRLLTTYVWWLLEAADSQIPAPNSASKFLDAARIVWMTAPHPSSLLLA